MGKGGLAYHLPLAPLTWETGVVNTLHTHVTCDVPELWPQRTLCPVQLRTLGCVYRWGLGLTVGEN